jgi:probable rRNA maturation factor
MTAGRGAGVSVLNRAGRKGVPTAASFERWVRAALRGRHQGRRQVNIGLFDETEARALNRRDRGRDYATNILSYAHEPLPGEKSRLLGDLAICPAVVRREAGNQGKPLRDHYAHLTIHGVLHLLGYDHETDAQAEQMETLERRILAGLGISDPYVVRGRGRKREPGTGSR